MKKNALLLLSALLLSGVFQHSYAQESTTRWYLSPEIKNPAAVFKNRTLLVSLIQEDKEEVEQLEKKGKSKDLEEYRQLIARTNERLQKGFPLGWTYSSVQFRTAQEIEALVAASPEQYLVISIAPFREDKVKIGFFSGIYYVQKQNALLLSAGQTRVCANLLPRQNPSYLDFMYTAQQIQNLLEIEDSERSDYITESTNVYTSSLKEKTLLIDSAMLSEEVRPKVIASAYPYPFKIVGRDQIKQAIESRDTTVAYVRVIKTINQNYISSSDMVFAAIDVYRAKKGKGGEELYTQLVVSAADGKILTFSDPGAMPPDDNEKIRRDDFKKFARALNPQGHK